MSSTPEPTEIVAHRAGNSIDTARVANSKDLIIEMDVHVLYGRVEVRHEKVLRPTRRLWERWYLLPRGTQGVPIGDVLREIDADTELMVDLKCCTMRAALRVLRALPTEQRVIVSTRCWRLLRAFEARPNTRRLRSCGNQLQLRFALLGRHRGSAVGISIHERLVNESSMERLRSNFGDVFAWAATSSTRCRELVRHGATGLILDDVELAEGI